MVVLTVFFFSHLFNRVRAPAAVSILILSKPPVMDYNSFELATAVGYVVNQLTMFISHVQLSHLSHLGSAPGTLPFNFF